MPIPLVLLALAAWREAEREPAAGCWPKGFPRSGARRVGAVWIDSFGRAEWPPLTIVPFSPDASHAIAEVVSGTDVFLTTALVEHVKHVLAEDGLTIREMARMLNGAADAGAIYMAGRVAEQPDYTDRPALKRHLQSFYAALVVWKFWNKHGCVPWGHWK